jgi:hypothetical protein
MVPRQTATGTSSPIHFIGGRELVNLRDSQGRDAWFYRSFMGTDGKQQGKWYPVGGVAKMKGGHLWIIKGAVPDLEKGYGRPDLKDLADRVNAILPKSDEEMNQFVLKYLNRSYRQAHNDGSLQAKRIDFSTLDIDNEDDLGLILNTWKDRKLNQVWGHRVNSDSHP